jgi:ATP-dependent helicase Lhr and Lhr-like helicase
MLKSRWHAAQGTLYERFMGKPEPSAFIAGATGAILPGVFLDWFASRGWSPRSHQLELMESTRAGRSVLLIAPTGAGKTLAGFLPALTELSSGESRVGRLHTLYLSPLKALAVDIERNLQTPILEMGLAINVETRTGDTPVSKRRRQRLMPPDILLTTPEQLALLISGQDAARFFGGLRYVIVDELHALSTNKRGHLMALGIARLRAMVPGLQLIGLSATVADPDALRRFLVPQAAELRMADLVVASAGARPDIGILQTTERMPWQGHTARFAIPDIYDAIARARTALVFVNTRFQAELLFQELWRINDQNLAIALHHGSLDATQRRRVERAMAGNALRAVVATSTLEMGIDWGDVDLVLHVGGPKGASRLAQRIGRANHRMDEPSRALLVPTNRFEVLECTVAIEANYVGAQDTDPVGEGNWDVLAQHVWGVACAGPFAEAALHGEIASAEPFRHVTAAQFRRLVEFVATGGYALKVYERYARIVEFAPGWWRLRHPRLAQDYRLNVGTIVEAPSLLVRLVKQKPKGPVARGGMVLGKIEEAFLEALVPGDTFIFSGRVLRFEGIRENECLVTDAATLDPKIPSYAGGKFPMSTYLAEGVRALLADPARWNSLPDEVADWLGLQRLHSMLPRRDGLLVETFPRAARHYLVAYAFEGRIAHQTLGMLLTRRLDRIGAKPMGFVANDYAIAIWGLEDMGRMVGDGSLSIDTLFAEDMLGDDLEAWLDESYMLKRTFRTCAVISGLIERRHPGKEKSGRQVTVSSDLIYDVLRRHEPDHVLLEATRRDAARGLLDIRRVGDLLARIRGRIMHKPLDRISPLAVPIMLEIGKEPVLGDARDALLDEAERMLIDEATS